MPDGRADRAAIDGRRHLIGRSSHRLMLCDPGANGPASPPDQIGCPTAYHPIYDSGDFNTHKVFHLAHYGRRAGADPRYAGGRASKARARARRTKFRTSAERPSLRYASPIGAMRGSPSIGTYRAPCA